MKTLVLVDRKEKMELEEKSIESKTLSMESLKSDLQFLHDILEKSSDNKKVETEEKKVAGKTISLEDLRDNIGKLSREERSSVLEEMDNLKGTNQKAIREEGFKNLPDDMQATLGMSADNLKKLTEDQRTTLVKKFDDILTVEKAKKKEGIIKDIIK